MAGRRAFERVFIMIFENELESAVRQDEFMLALEARGVRLSDYHGVAHPSQPNYVAAIAGVPVVADDTVQDIDRPNLIDLLESKGITWKAYMENLPTTNKALAVSSDGLYFRKHNPFISFNNIRNDPSRLANIVNATELAADVAANRLPQFCWYTPNIQNDGHSPPSVQPGDSPRSVAFLSGWLKGFLPPLLGQPYFMDGTLVVIVFDESIPHADNHVYATLLGNMLKPGTTEGDRYNHYSLLRTVEENFQLGTLGNSDVTSNWFEFLWGVKPRPFDWSLHRQ
jgi:Phosphoesterase family